MMSRLNIKTSLTAFCLLCVCFTGFDEAPTLAQAQPAYLQKLMQANQALAENRLPDAEKTMAEALREAERLKPQDDRLATVLNDQGWLYYRMDKPAKAESALNRALALRRKLKAPADINQRIATTLNNLGLVLVRLNKKAQAEKAYKDAITAFGAVATMDDKLAAACNNLALLYTEQKKYDPAESLYKRVLENGLDKVTPDNLARTIDNLCTLYQVSGRQSRAQNLTELALRVSQLKGDEMVIANTLHNLAALDSKAKNYAPALKVQVRSFDIYRTVLGADHPAVAKSLDDLAGIYASLKDKARAEECYREAIEIALRALGPEHKGYQACVNDYIVFLKAQGRTEEARKLESHISRYAK
ncbi:MAG: tetratricopeptide repeat protein [Candidatus Melainabacteria bacterium]|jgi:tetratricopeptide (TPR) repeat protein|nr:tetratricopeptide repeat protein [Candidatus Melainabacteria bacterium]